MRKRTQQDFINDAKEVHREKYDYSEVNYVNRITKVKIICLEHGEFFQRPSEHLSGNGCTPLAYRSCIIVFATFQQCGLIGRLLMNAFNIGLNVRIMVIN